MDSFPLESVTTLAEAVVARCTAEVGRAVPAIQYRNWSSTYELADSRFAREVKSTTDLSRASYTRASWIAIAQVATENAKYLAFRGVSVGKRVVVIGQNSMGSICAELAITALGGVTVPLHTNLPFNVISRLVDDANPMLVLTDDYQTALRLKKENRIEVEPLNFAWGVNYIRHGQDSQRSDGTDWRDLENVRQWLAECAAQVKSHDLASIIYTSGTTGEPRGVMLTHANVLSNARAATEAFASQHHEVRLNMLPFSHAFARTADLYTWLLRGSTMAIGSTRETIFADLLEVRPTFITAVPYFYDRLWKRLRAQGIEQEPDAVRNALGGNIRACVSGGAGLPPDVEDYYANQGVPILQGYGLTEASPIVSMSTKTTYRAQTVGKPSPGTELRFADDGELLVKGPQVMSGYWRDEEATANAFDNGWLKTGDIARLDDDGMLVITGRKKESIVLSTGHNVWPATLEARLMSDPYIAQVAIVGEGQAHLTALIVPEPELLRRFVKEKRLWVFTKGQALRHRMVRELYASRIADRLGDCARHEQITRFILLPRAFSLNEGEVTPKLSLRRDVIARRFAREISKVV